MASTPAAQRSAAAKTSWVGSSAPSVQRKATADQKLSVDGYLQHIDDLAAKLGSSPDAISPLAWRKQSAAFGLPGIDLPVSFGGQGRVASDVVKIFEHMGKRSLNLRDMIGGGHVRPLVASASPESRAIVEQVVQGKAYVAIAITEKEAGSNMRAMQSRSTKVPGGYQLTGEKMFNARFETASHIILFVKSAQPRPEGTGLNAFIVPKDHPGLHFKKLSAHGLYGNSFGGVSFNKVFVPDSFRIGGEGEGGKLFRDHFLYWRLMQAAAAVGTGKGALEQTAQRMRTRQAFGGPIGRFTHLQQDLGEHTAKLHMASLLVRDAAAKIDAGDYAGAAPLVAMAKGEGVEMALKASDFAMETFGAEGYSPDLTDLGQRVRDLQGLRIADGTTHIMRETVVQHVYGADFWDMAIGTSAKGRAEDHASGAIEALRQQSADLPNVLASQERYDGLVKADGGGACPTVCAANLVQGLGVMSGKAPVLDLDKVIREAYRSDAKLANGRLSNEQVVDLLEFYRKRFLPQLQWTTEVDYLRTGNKLAQPPGARGWTDFDATSLEARPREMKMLSYTVEDASGRVLGRHFVILKEKVGNTLFVVDPQKPSKNYAYELKRVELADGGSSFLLTRPDMAGRAATKFTLNSVVTVKLDGKKA